MVGVMSSYSEVLTAPSSPRLQHCTGGKFTRPFKYGDFCFSPEQGRIEERRGNIERKKKGKKIYPKLPNLSFTSPAHSLLSK